jgi:hypothetical protein
MNEWIKEGQRIQRDEGLAPGMGVKEGLSEEVPFKQASGRVKEGACEYLEEPLSGRRKSSTETLSCIFKEKKEGKKGEMRPEKELGDKSSRTS